MMLDTIESIGELGHAEPDGFGEAVSPNKVVAHPWSNDPLSHGCRLCPLGTGREPGVYAWFVDAVGATALSSFAS